MDYCTDKRVFYEYKIYSDARYISQKQKSVYSGIYGRIHITRESLLARMRMNYAHTRYMSNPSLSDANESTSLL